MAQQATKVKETEDSFSDKNNSHIIDEYKALNDKVDSVLEKISKKQKKSKK